MNALKRLPLSLSTMWGCHSLGNDFRAIGVERGLSYARLRCGNLSGHERCSISGKHCSQWNTCTPVVSSHLTWSRRLTKLKSKIWKLLRWLGGSEPNPRPRKYDFEVGARKNPNSEGFREKSVDSIFPSNNSQSCRFWYFWASNGTDFHHPDGPTCTEIVLQRCSEPPRAVLSKVEFPVKIATFAGYRDGSVAGHKWWILHCPWK